MRTRRIGLAALSVVATLAVAACNPFGPPKLSTKTYDEFSTSIIRIMDDLREGDPEKLKAFELAFKKMTAYAAFRPTDIDLSKGIVILDVASVLPRSFDGIQRSAFATMGSVINGFDADQVIEFARLKEEQVIKAYQARVDEGLAGLDSRIHDFQEREKATEALLGNIVFFQPTIGIHLTGGAPIPDLRSEILNGSPGTLTAMALRITMRSQGSSVVEKDISLRLTSSPISSGDRRQFSVVLDQPEWFAVRDGQRHPVEVKVLAYMLDDGRSVSLAEVQEATALLRKQRDMLVEYRKSVPSIVRDSFTKQR